MKRIVSGMTVPCLMMMLALVSVSREPLRAAVADRDWQIVVDHRQTWLKLENDTFFTLASDESNGGGWVYAGSLQGLVPSSVGLYVGNLDGSGESSIAFYEAHQHVWYHGTIVSGQMVLRRVEGENFQVGNGPILYPIDDPAEDSLPGATRAVPHTAKASFPVMAQQHTKLATSRSMDTTITLYADGGMYAVTTVSNGVWLAGYHGKAQVTLWDENGRKIVTYDGPPIGVTGTAFGHPIVTASWQAWLTGDALAAARKASILQMWDPDFNTITRDVRLWLDLVLKLLQPLVPFIPKG
jgi:hypothetical protein